MGYYLPVNNKQYRLQGAKLAHSIFFLFISLLRLVVAMLYYLGVLIFTCILFLIRLLKRKFPRQQAAGKIQQ